MAPKLTLIVNESPNFSLKRQADLTMIPGGKRDNFLTPLINFTKKSQSKKLRALNKLKQNPFGKDKKLTIYKEQGDLLLFFLDVPFVFSLMGLFFSLFAPKPWGYLETVFFVFLAGAVTVLNWHKYRDELVIRRSRDQWQRFNNVLNSMDDSDDSA
jgi:hypothetical protein